MTRKALAIALFVVACGLAFAAAVMEGGMLSTGTRVVILAVYALAFVAGWPEIREFTKNEFRDDSAGWSS